MARDPTGGKSRDAPARHPPDREIRVNLPTPEETEEIRHYLWLIGLCVGFWRVTLLACLSGTVSLWGPVLVRLARDMIRYASVASGP